MTSPRIEENLVKQSDRASLKELQTIPGVGKSIASDLLALRIRSLSQLRGKNPERMYARRCEQLGQRIDPCLLYVFRCAVYFAETKSPNPELLKWWNWKERR
jgi:hypothetical protein